MVNKPEGEHHPPNPDSSSPTEPSSSSVDHPHGDPESGTHLKGSATEDYSESARDPLENDPSLSHSVVNSTSGDSPVELESVAQESDMDHAHAAAIPDPSTRRRPAGARRQPEHKEQEPEDEEEGGGPVKSFLEHLEDLRWMLIKVIAAVLIGMVVCLVAADQLVEALDYPLTKAQIVLAKKEGVVLFKMGTNVVWRFQRGDVKDWALPLGSNRVEVFNLVPAPVASNSYAFMIERDDTTKSDAPPPLISLKTYTPMGPFTVAIQLALYGGLGLASPFVLYFIGQFVVPALKRREKRFVFQALGIGSVLFMSGVLFCYFIMLQAAINAAVTISHWMSFGADEWRAEEYISFVCKLMLGMGLAFESPVVILTLVKIGLLDYERLNKFRPYAVIVNMIFSSILTPDVISMCMMAIPLQILYEISVVISRYWKRKDRALAV